MTVTESIEQFQDGAIFFLQDAHSRADVFFTDYICVKKDGLVTVLASRERMTGDKEKDIDSTRYDHNAVCMVIRQIDFGQGQSPVDKLVDMKPDVLAEALGSKIEFAPDNNDETLRQAKIRQFISRDLILGRQNEFSHTMDLCYEAKDHGLTEIDLFEEYKIEFHRRFIGKTAEVR